MGTSTIVTWVIVLALARLLYNYSRLNSLPGPFYAGLSDFWRIDAQKSLNYGRELVELHAKYGTIVRVGPNSISVSNPGAILPVQARRIPRQRRSENGTVSVETALQYEGRIDQSARNLLSAFRRHQTLEITAFLHFFVTDFVNQLRATLTVPTREDEGSIHHVCDISHDHPPDDLRAWLTLPGAEYLLFQGPASRLKRSRDTSILHKERLSTRLDSQQRSASPLPSMRVISEGAPCRSEEILDRFASIIPSVFVHLLINANIMTKLRREIASAQNRGFLSSLPLWTELNKLQYLDAVMKECIRHSPDRCDSCELIAPTGGVTIASHYVPQGTAIRCHSHALHYNSEIYGEQPHLFSPERWLNVTVTDRGHMTKCLFPFTQGGFEHPTVYAAWNELKKVVVMILLKFDLQLLHVDDGQVSHTGISPDLPRATVRFEPRVH